MRSRWELGERSMGSRSAEQFASPSAEEQHWSRVTSPSADGRPLSSGASPSAEAVATLRAPRPQGREWYTK